MLTKGWMPVVCLDYSNFGLNVGSTREIVPLELYGLENAPASATSFGRLGLVPWSATCPLLDVDSVGYLSAILSEQADNNQQQQQQQAAENRYSYLVRSY